MKTIGIKLADGTFYPVLEEGTPKKRMLDLTTAKDNQTKVQIDLYRSETGTMEDAEYVDTLEVTKLNPHPNGEPELHLSVGLDEENHLTAEVVDPETGKKSETEVTLVSRTLAEREGSVDSDITDANVSEDTIADTAGEATFSPDDLPDINSSALEDMPFSFDGHDNEKAEEPEDSDTVSFEGALPDFSDLDNEVPVEDTTLESIDFSKTDFDDAKTDDVIGTESPSLEDTTVEDTAEKFTTNDFSLPDFDSIDTEDTTDTADTTEVAASSDTDTVDFEHTDLPDFSTDFDSDFSSSADSDPFASDTSSSSTTGLNFDDLDDPAFSTPSFDSTEFDSTLDSLNSQSEDNPFDDIGSSASTGSAMDFSDLYDKETIAGEHASLYDEEEENKKTRTPVIICIVCAIICVIATVLLLFVVPSKYNLLASRNTNGVSLLDRFFSKHKETVVEKQVETPVQIEEPQEETKFIDVVVQEPENTAAPEAVEDKIVIAPEPEKVVPAPAPVEERKPEVKKTEDVTYHIKWGDTLWDISESYYKTPWKYPKIADYNKIRNPDLIISGTDILIPAE